MPDATKSVIIPSSATKPVFERRICEANSTTTVEPIKFEFKLEKKLTYRKNLDDLLKGIRNIAEAAKRNASRNFVATFNDEDDFICNPHKSGGYHYKASIWVSRSKYNNKQQVLDDWEKTRRVMEKAAKTNRWDVIDEGDSVLDDIVIEPTIIRTQTEMILPPLTNNVMKQYFGRLFNREPQIRLMYDTLATAVNTKFKERNHCLLKGLAGCITGEAVVEINRAGKSYNVTLEELCEKFNHTEIIVGHNKEWDRTIFTKIRCRTEDGTIRLKTIRAVLDQGEKETFTISVGNKTIRATPDHEFLTTKGWKRLDTLKIGDMVHLAADKVRHIDKKKYKKNYYPNVSSVPMHPNATQGYPPRVPKNRIVYEAFMNHLPVDEYIEVLRNPILYNNLKPFHLSKKDIVHHKDENPRNNAIENLELMSRVKHSTKHAKEGAWKHVTAKSEVHAITDIQYFGIENVYDVSLGEEPHNFLANGFVVHNCGKTEILLAYEQWLGEEWILSLDATTLSKAGLEKLLIKASQEKRLAPIVKIEEIEKVTEPKSLNSLLQGMDTRARIQRTNARDGDLFAEFKSLVWATCNDSNLLRKFADGALWSRFSMRPTCKRPNQDTMKKILMRVCRDVSDAGGIAGDERHVNVVLEFMWGPLKEMNEYKADYNDPRLGRALLSGGDRLLSKNKDNFLSDFVKVCDGNEQGEDS